MHRVLIALIISWAVISAGSIEKVLQNGLDNYDGCTDSYIREKNASLNFGNRQELIIDYKYG